MTIEEKIEGFPNLWADYVNQGELQKLLGLYNDTATLLPTFSPRSVNTEEKLIEYFEKLSSRDGLNVSLHDNTVHPQKIGAQSYVISGIYSFKFEVDGTLLTFPSRFTFVVDLSLEKPILHHHSSQIPRNLS
ncbi:MAG: DUF4440 domain-containing protein [Cellvibrionaceae bacterium]